MTTTPIRPDGRLRVAQLGVQFVHGSYSDDFGFHVPRLLLFLSNRDTAPLTAYAPATACSRLGAGIATPPCRPGQIRSRSWWTSYPPSRGRCELGCCSL